MSTWGELGGGPYDGEAMLILEVALRVRLRLHLEDHPRERLRLDASVEKWPHYVDECVAHAAPRSEERREGSAAPVGELYSRVGMPRQEGVRISVNVGPGVGWVGWDEVWCCGVVWVVWGEVG